MDDELKSMLCNEIWLVDLQRRIQTKWSQIGIWKEEIFFKGSAVTQYLLLKDSPKENVLVIPRPFHLFLQRIFLQSY